MSALTYKNTKTTLPNWSGSIHEEQPRGVAYETDTHFVHFYCRDEGWYTLSTGLTTIQKKEGTLEDWVVNVFGATDIKEIQHSAGEAHLGIWRPGLFYDSELSDAIGSTPPELHESLISVRISLEKLEDLFSYVEPSANGLEAYSHKSRELLILSCTEVENQWKRYMMESNTPSIGGNYTTRDYVKLAPHLRLAEFKMRLKPYPLVGDLLPFQGWDVAQPTQSLAWYDAYNKTKHDRAQHFDKATLYNCIQAVCASIVLFSVRFSPYALIRESGSAQSLFGQLFDIELTDFDPTSFYVPKVLLPEGTRDDLFVYDSYHEKHIEAWNCRPLII